MSDGAPVLCQFLPQEEGLHAFELPDLPAGMGAGGGFIPGGPQSAMQALQDAVYAQARQHGQQWNGLSRQMAQMAQMQPPTLPTYNTPLAHRPVIIVMNSSAADRSGNVHADPDSDSDDSVPDLLCPSCMAADDDPSESGGALGTSRREAGELSPASAPSDAVQDGEAENEAEECWLCFCDGPVESLAAPQGSAAAAAEAAGSTSASAVRSNASSGCQRCWSSGSSSGRVRPGRAGDVKENMDALVAPCGICMGGMRYIHRSCFDRYLKTTWSLACPNCARPYTL